MGAPVTSWTAYELWVYSTRFMLIALVKSFTDVHDLRGPIEYRRYGTGWYRSTEYDGTESTRDTILSSTCYLLLLTLVLIILLSPHGKMRDCVYICSVYQTQIALQRKGNNDDERGHRCREVCRDCMSESLRDARSVRSCPEVFERDVRRIVVRNTLFGPWRASMVGITVHVL